MGKMLNGIVIDDDLFQEYHKFRKGEAFNQEKIRQLLHYYKKSIVSRICIYNRLLINILQVISQKYGRNL